MTIPTVTAEIQFDGVNWTSVTQWLVRSCETRRGSSRVESPIIRYEPGHVTFRLDNSDRRFDPTNTFGPYVRNGISDVVAMRPVRLKAIWKGTTYPLFRGFVDLFDVDWTADVYSEVTVTATDGFKVLANKRRQALDVLVGDAEETGARITRILDSAGWSVTDRIVDTGNSFLQATDLSGAALAELQAAAESEVGELYIDASGRLVFRDRLSTITDTRSAQVQCEFGLYASSPMAIEAKLNSDDATLWNEAVVTRRGGLAQVAVDAASVSANQYKTYERSDVLLMDDITTHDLAEWVVYISRDPEVRFDVLTLKPQSDPDLLFQQVLTREIGDRIRITRRPPGTPVSREVFIRGVAHSITQENWTTQWILQSATRYVSNFFILGSSSLDQGILSY